MNSKGMNEKSSVREELPPGGGCARPGPAPPPGPHVGIAQPVMVHLTAAAGRRTLLNKHTHQSVKPPFFRNISKTICEIHLLLISLEDESRKMPAICLISGF